MLDYVSRIETLAPSLGLGVIRGRREADALIRQLTKQDDERSQLLLERLDIGGILSRSWAVGVTTTQRSPETLTRCLASLNRTGWDDVHIFADGATVVPGGYAVTTRTPKVGAFANWYLSLCELVHRNVKATNYLLVQDDALFCDNVRAFVETLPLHDAITSLYRSAFYADGDTFDHNGGTTFVGAVALVIPQAIARRILSSEFAVEHRLRNVRSNDFIDGSLGEWCQSNEVPLRVVGPTLCQHIGDVSTLGHDERPATSFPGERFDAESLLISKPARRHKAKIGLVGYNTAQGLGYFNRDAAAGLDVDRWLVIRHDKFRQLPAVDGIDTTTVREHVDHKFIINWLEGLDVVVFAETSVPARLPEIARSRGIRTVCVPMVEWLPDDDWTREIDLWLAPTKHSANVLVAREVKGNVISQPWPIDSQRITYRQRKQATRFVFAHGNGGPRDRKGGLIVADAARLTSTVIDVWSQTATHRSSLTQPIDWSKERVNFLGASTTPDGLYIKGDVFLAPSRWEGLGLQLLECQAAGMPLITTDGAPMNEVQAWKLVEADASIIRLSHPMISHDVRPESLAETIEQSTGQDIREASRAARDYVASHRCWRKLGPSIRRLIAD